ncbi:OPT oligopeptide transporter protein-domain-containing protein [Thelonectria olida]|uniref:OPT oligopeptide transporter protein-domain-containing protein n=1 Tax=Thelonectria olida TaxID=1576542 RepID=A0A9P9AU47_9HYPO|nr:OPT oligopeptide transporter protein-domain-containing protein [Thelonectria olida]
MAEVIQKAKLPGRSDQDREKQHDLDVTHDDLLEAKEIAEKLTLEETRKMMTQVHALHKWDPNFPLSIIEKIELFIGNEDVFKHPEKHQKLIEEIKIEAALITNNSPYAEVRAVVDNHDDPSMPCSTIRAWAIGIVFSVAISFINAFFDIRQPNIYVSSNVPQLLAYPVGKLFEKLLPDVGFTLCGVRHSLNPGPFNKKEHMLITIMSTVSKDVPYTNYIIWIQYLPIYFNQPWAISFGYQITIALSTNFIGYGLAGLCRRFLVYPSYCVWPASLVTIALNTAFHNDGNIPVAGPFRKLWQWSRLKFFAFAFALMFFYFWVPNYLFAALSFFSWMTWIAPTNVNLSLITGGLTGMALNPLPTWDWNILTTYVDPLMVPFFSTLNFFVGGFVTFFIVVAIYYTNTYNTAYLPINSNRVWDHFAHHYNVSAILDERGILDGSKYEAYSPPFLSAACIVLYTFFFAVYTSTVTYGILYHHREIAIGFRDLVNSMRPSKKHQVEAGQVLDVHNRLMESYREVPEWWYLAVLVMAVVLGVVGIAQWPTYTTPAVVLYGIVLCLIFVVPVGIIRAMTGVEVTLNVLAEFIGGSWVEGNALAMCFFKTYGFVCCSQALSFSNDLKLAHYLKIPPRFTFWAQMVPTVVSTFVCVAIVQYQVNLKDVCTEKAAYRFFCPGINTFFMAAVLWGTVGPKKMWGIRGQYVETLVGFPLGVIVTVILWWLGRKYPKNRLLRNAHPVVIFNGGLIWAPYNFSYVWPAVPIGWFSWVYMKSRYLGLWSKYNYVLSAAFSAGIAISALVTFFALQYRGIEVSWWGNNAPFEGCDGTGSCALKRLANGEDFGPRFGNFH